MECNADCLTLTCTPRVDCSKAMNHEFTEDGCCVDGIIFDLFLRTRWWVKGVRYEKKKKNEGLNWKMMRDVDLYEGWGLDQVRWIQGW